MSVVVDGKVIFAAGEERFSRKKQHAGFPRLALQAALDFTGLKPEDIDGVGYAFYPWDEEAKLMRQSFAKEAGLTKHHDSSNLKRKLAEAAKRVPNRTEPVHGLPEPNHRMHKGFAKETYYKLSGISNMGSKRAAAKASEAWVTPGHRGPPKVAGGIGGGPQGIRLAGQAATL